MVPVQEMKRWLFWIFYIDPMQYAYSALMVGLPAVFFVPCANI